MVKYKFWDIGEVSTVRPSKAAMSSIMLGLIQCGGRLHDTYSPDLKDGEWRYSTASCSVLLRISLPEGMEVRFAEMTQIEVSPAPVVGVN